MAKAKHYLYQSILRLSPSHLKQKKHSNKIKNLALFLFTTWFFYNISEASIKKPGDIYWTDRKSCRQSFYNQKKQKLSEMLQPLIDTAHRNQTSHSNTIQIVGEADLHNSINEPVFQETKRESYTLNPNYHNELIQVLSPIIISHPKGVIITTSLTEAEKLKALLKTTFTNVEFEVSHFLLSSAEKQKILENSNNKDSHYIIIPSTLSYRFF